MALENFKKFQVIFVNLVHAQESEFSHFSADIIKWGLMLIHSFTKATKNKKKQQTISKWDHHACHQQNYPYYTEFDLFNQATLQRFFYLFATKHIEWSKEKKNLQSIFLCVYYKKIYSHEKVIKKIVFQIEQCTISLRIITSEYHSYSS